MRFILDGISLSVESNEADAISRGLKKLRASGIRARVIETNICKKSVDARKKDEIKLV